MKFIALLALVAVFATVSAEVYFEEKFDDTWASRWTPSDWKKADGTAGEFTHTAGKWYGDAEADKGLQTGPDARFYSISADMGKTISNEGKSLVLQFSAKHEQKMDCGGGYIKLMPSTADMKTFGGDTPYSIMFGPDICGYSTKRVHVIFTYEGKNLLIKQTIPCETDELTHVYTLVVHANNTYAVLIDNVEKEAGNLEEHWDFLAAKTIKDPLAVKPADWDENARIPDVTDVKPEGHDDIPEMIKDPEAAKPADWDDEDDGEWEAPNVANPDFKGAWTQKEIDNPAYKGMWEAADVPNPEYKESTTLYKFDDMRYVGFELWQVKAGSIFDNVLVTDDVAYAAKFAEDTWGKNKAGEKEMFDAVEAEKKAVEDAESKKLEEEAKANQPAGGAAEDEEDEYDDADAAKDDAAGEADADAKDELKRRLSQEQQQQRQRAAAAGEHRIHHVMTGADRRLVLMAEEPLIIALARLLQGAPMPGRAAG
eukprot:CAMPEP_0197591348 /NCGR_PEP_ID=MMETSP1326-20131121/13019_1 /TAXON_ID=1155430 /ORGANISM="Genus nov. species nov., Strain RCC2288" /LENGTH=482 /DNA_ID=CAMNT_0043156753 /DNA_START=43 /DNA_END=1493 /DNA_ORIENTATION=+